MTSLLTSQLYPWLHPILMDEIELDYYNWLVSEETDDAKQIWKDFWETVPEHVKEFPSEIEYMWDDYILQRFEPWIEDF